MPPKRPLTRRGPRNENHYPEVSIPLGSGHHGSGAFKTAVAICYATLAPMLREGRVVRWGSHQRTELGITNHLDKLIGRIFRINPQTAAAFKKNYGENVDEGEGLAGVQAHLPEPQKPGRKRQTGRNHCPILYDVIYAKYLEARQNGETLTIQKLRDHIETTSIPDKSYAALRFSLVRMGFEFGRVSRVLKSRRGAFVEWLHRYCEKRVQYLQNPDPSLVHLFVDETFVYRDEAGNMSWYHPEEPDGRKWSKSVGDLPHTRWGIVQGLFWWWEVEAGNAGDVPAPDPYARGPRRGRKRKGRGSGRPVPLYAPGAPVLQGAPVYRRRFLQTEHTLGTWNCSLKGGNVNAAKFMDWLRTVLEFAKLSFAAGKTIIIHLDNASYHKAAPPGAFSLKDASSVDIIFEICNRCTELGFVPDDFFKADGSTFPKRELERFYREHVEPPPKAIMQLAGEFSAHVEFTPPYWPDVQPVEMFNNNLKCDYRDRGPDERGPNVGSAATAFCSVVSEADVRGWVEFTDSFCRAVVERDADVLSPLELDLVSGA